MNQGTLQALIALLKDRGYQVVGPRLRDQAIVLDLISDPADLPAGCTSEQEAATYRVKQGPGSACFAYGPGPQSWKKFLHPADVRVFRAQRESTSEGRTLRILPEGGLPPRYALLGVRACDLAAIAIHDRVLLKDRFRDDTYQARREHTLVVAVNCTHSSPTCFCSSMDTGPRVQAGFDLLLTEIAVDGRPEFLVEAGSDAGRAILDQLATREAPAALVRQAEDAVRAAATSQTRTIETKDLEQALLENPDHPEWDKVAARCLACANCTMVCPTCFCTTVEDTTDLTGDHAERWRRWDSCFTLGFSYIHGGSVRVSAKARYRQWLTHKLATWVTQFGTAGCVGCGRCITWCPVGIDITEEVRALRRGPDLGKEDGNGES